MGRHIDRIAAFIAATAAFYLFFLNAWHSVPAACAAAFAAMALGRALIQRKPRRRRCSRGQAEDEVLRIAALPDDDAQRRLDALLRGSYPDEDFALAAILKHPGASLSASDVLGAWKAHRGAARLVVAATCACDPAAALYARELRDPAVVVADRRTLARIIRARGDLSEAQRPPFSLRRAWRGIVRRAAAHRARPKDALAAALMLALYVVLGRPLYLAVSLGLLLRFGAALPARGIDRRLFDA